ncbi:MAG: phage holin family protein [Armatimonadota bacterium]|nr:phage holin family protein [Armatimonadota bacterium]
MNKLKHWAIRLVLSALALYLTSLVLHGVGQALASSVPHELSRFTLSAMTIGPDWGRAALAVLALSLVNSFIRPVVGFFGKPLSFLTLGLSSLAVNSALFWAVGYFTGGYEVRGVVALILGPVLLGLGNGALSLFVRD